jgi:hypothetical protein
MALGVILSDIASTGTPSQYLGERIVVSSEPGHFSIKSSPVDEVLRFTIPSHSNIRRFDQITVVFLPSPQHDVVGARIAIQKFILYPR